MYCGVNRNISLHPNMFFISSKWASSVMRLNTERVKNLREVFMTKLEGQLKRLQAFSNYLYHGHYALLPTAPDSSVTVF
jgi:hypothetical protein